ncbi:MULTISPECIES: hypothetical protein [unclassified Pantoea]|uniref:hypothetical protein n=1 Tax=unclassified Pantoea TaxID=2630326 RepID=UPI001CD73336|nr:MULTISPECIES: hypothetical protein [unclassified Pantoea]MCA1176175.1 hypothetical protein [Pantoea sp. alder69]MCA1249145.1 hypothetical protein [Pantoea sp. alder70]MCA1264780.1 hypothetical protein [Pantoea sp. alder81]
MSNNKAPAVVVTHFPASTLEWIDKVRGKKSRQAWLARMIKDMRLDYELEVIIEQTGSAN